VDREYSFRLRFRKSPRDTLNIDEPRLILPKRGDDPEIALVSTKRDIPIKDAPHLVLKASGWHSKEAADFAGRLYSDILARTLVRLRVGADFGARAPKSGFTEDGLRMLQNSMKKIALNDVHGLMVYESTGNPQIVFTSMQADMVRGIQVDRFLEVFNHALLRIREISDRERVSIELFNESFFQMSADARFLLLMSGLEALIQQGPRSRAIVNHIQLLMDKTEDAIDLSPQEKGELKGGLGQLKRESIRQAAKSLLGEKLDFNTYADLSPSEFFDKCYTLRSRLVHGESPLPTREEVDPAAAQLEVMLSDLISYDLLDIGPT
jgi:hypothetical protein